MRRFPFPLPRLYLIPLGILWIGLVLLIPGCAARDVINIERPNARTDLEEKAYNLLLVSETIISRAERSNAAGTLPEFMKPVMNKIIDLHNDTREAANSYVELLEAGTEEEGFEALDALITDLSDAIDNLFTSPGTATEGVQ